MFLRRRQVVLAVGVVVPIALLVGCAATPAEPAAAPGSMSIPAPSTSVTLEASPSASATSNPSMSAASDATPTPIDGPLLTIEGAAVGPDSQALAVELTLTDVLPITEESLDELRVASCDPSTDLSAFEDPDARMVVFDVVATGTPGFTSWDGYRGIQVSGLLFDGPIFSSPVNGDVCETPQLVTRPGVGSVQVPVTPEAWRIEGALPDDAAVTFGQYGLSVFPFDEEGRPTGMTEISDCAIEASPTLDELAMTAAPAISWGSQSPAPEYCLYGRIATDG